MRQVLFVSILMVSIAASLSGQPKRHPIEGVWKVVEREAPDGKGKITNPAPGMRMFTAKHYAWMASPEERPALAFDKATDSQKAALWNFVSQMGTYELRGANVITHPSVAKDPATMTPAHSEEFTFRFEGNRLVLKTVRPAGAWVWTTYERLE
jgi:hypothetical protein